MAPSAMRALLAAASVAAVALAANTLTLTQFPAAGATTAISGKFAGPANPAAYKAIMYLQGGDGNWWSKPQGGSSSAIAADGTFTITNWATATTDAAFKAIQLFIIPTGTAVTTVLGAALPAAMNTAAAASGNYAQGYTVTGGAGVTFVAIHMTLPAMGVNAAIKGTITGTAGMTYSKYKVAVLTSGDNGATWWDKSHTPYFLKQQSNPAYTTAGTDQNAAVVINSDWSWTLSGWVGDPNDLTSGLFRAYLVPSTYDMSWPTYQIEGTGIRADLPAAAIAWVEQNRNGNVVTNSGGRTIAASPAASAGGGTVVAPSTAAAASPSSAAPAASPSFAAPAAGATLTLTAPLLGSAAAITGKLSGVTIAGQKIAVYVKDAAGVLWGSKPAPGNTATVAADGSFTLANWASGGAGDVNAPALVAYALPATATAPSVLGAAAPASLTSAAIASVTWTRTATAASPAPPAAASPSNAAAASPSSVVAASPSPVAASPSSASTAATLSITAPAVGDTAAVAGRYTGGTSATHKVAVYVRTAAGLLYGPKPQDGNTAAVAADGSWTLANWASGGASDAAAPALVVMVMPAASTPLALNGAAMPAALPNSAVAGASVDRTTGAATAITTAGGTVVVPSPSAPSTPSASPSVGASKEVAFPPGDGSTGARVAAANGYINFAGYRWVVKNTNYRVGPGNNLFSNDVNHIWTDNWGLHLTVAPTSGCNTWVSTEVWLDHKLGFGTYLFRYVGPVENVDPDITVSPFFIWDDTGNAANGYREIDFEYARWGNGGDPTSSQFVLRPLQSGGDVPGWKVRYSTKTTPYWQGTGQGSGTCAMKSQTDFNGAGISKLTCVLRWFAGALSQYCVTGHYTLATMPFAPASVLLASQKYAYPQYVPDEGDARVHINHWIQDGNVPYWGRSSHFVIAGFEYTKTNVAFTNFPDTTGIVQRFLLGEPHEDRNLADVTVSAASQSSGDPSGQGYIATAAYIQAASYSDSTSTAASGGSGSGASKESALQGGLVAAIVIGIVGMGAMFFAGFQVARRSTPRYTPVVAGEMSNPLAQAQLREEAPSVKKQHRVVPRE